MSKVDVMLPQERLPRVVNPKSPKQSVAAEIMQTEVVSNIVQTEIDVEEFVNSDGKQSEFQLLRLNSDTASELKAESRVLARKKKRRGKKRKWKPYGKLTWDEELEERDSKRANRMRPGMSSCRLTLAPYNTTQFLMEDHNLQEPDYEHIPNGHRHRENSNSMDSSDEYYSSPEDEEDFLHRQFIETYENIHIERLNNMTKTELVQELMYMEDKVETLEKSLHEERLQRNSEKSEPRPSGQDLEAQLEKIRVYREEIKKLAEENAVLRKENERLRNRTNSVGEPNFLQTLGLSPPQTNC